MKHYLLFCLSFLLARATLKLPAGADPRERTTPFSGLFDTSEVDSVNWTLNSTWSPYQWVRERNLGGLGFFHMHIPKTAGLSFIRDFLTHIPEKYALYSAEACYNQYTAKPSYLPRRGDGIITMLRKPRAQVYSQYLECAEDAWGLKVVPPVKRYLLRNLSVWLRHFTDHGFEEDDMGCYHPFNMQARAFLCDGLLHHAKADQQAGILNMTSVMTNFNSAFFVGLSEYYQESICLLYERITKKLPAWCNCEAPAWSKASMEHESHGVSKHDVSRDLTAEDIERIKLLSEADEKLYAVAEDRFRKELTDVEAKHGVKILCESETGISKLAL